MDAANDTTQTEAQTPDPSLVARGKEPGGFWVPNALVDLHLKAVGTEGVAVYCVLARAVTPRHYPSVADLCAMLTRGKEPYPERRVKRALLSLYDRGLLNDYDVDCLLDACDREPPDPPAAPPAAGAG